MDNPYLPAKRSGSDVARYEPNERERKMAALAHASILFSGGLAAPVIWLLFKGSSPYVARHAARASWTHLGGGLLVTGLAAVTCGIGGVLYLPLIGFALWEAKNAWGGGWDAFKRSGE